MQNRLIRKSAFAAFAAFLACAGTAQASGSITCHSADDNVVIDLLVGRAEAITILRTIITIGDKAWSSDPANMPGTPIVAAQAFEDSTRLLVDFGLEAAGAVVARLRAVNASEGADFVSGGVFSFKDIGAWPVDCSERG